MLFFFVKDSRNKTLYPSIKTRWADKLVKQGRAKWIRRKVIILQLNYPVNEPPRDQISYFVIGMDTGYTNVGFAVYKITNGKELKLFDGKGLLRTSEIKEFLQERKLYRRGRRQNTRRNNDTPKFKHVKYRRVREIVDGLTKVHSPTCRHLAHSHFNIMEQIYKLVPKDHLHLNIEYVAFDMQKITGNSNLPGEGTWGNAQQYVLNRDNHTCMNEKCGKTNCKLEVHHKIQRAHGGTDQPSNLITLCVKCHKKHHAGKIDMNGVSPPNVTRQTTIGIIMPEIYAKLAKEIPVYKYYGYETKEYRWEHGIEKSHENDANCLALMGIEANNIIDFKIHLEFQQFRRHRRSATIRREDRKYYVFGDPDKKIVAWNRKARQTQKPACPSLMEYRKTHISQKLIATPGRRIYYRNKYNTTNKTPGAIIRDTRDKKIHVVKTTDASYIRTTTGLKVENRYIEWIKKPCGMVLL